MKEALQKIAAMVLALWTSRKLWMTVFGVSVLYGLYWHSAYHITQLGASLGADRLVVLLPILNEMYQTVMWGIVTAIGVLLGFSTLDKFTRGTSGVANLAAKFISEHKEEKIEITEKVDINVVQKFAEQYKDDPSYRPIETVPDLNVENFR